MDDPQHGFIKGDLSRVGAIELQTDFDRVALHAGVQRIGPRWYSYLEPQLDLKLADRLVKLSLTVPLRTLLYDETAPVDEAWQGSHVRLREEDWDEAGDYLKLLQYLTVGGKEQETFLSISRTQPVTLGHGALVRRYASNLDIDHTRTTLEFDAYNDYLGMEAFIGDVASPSVMGGMVFIKPDALLGPDRPLQRLSLGFSVASDVGAPLALSSVARPDGQYLEMDAGGRPSFREQAVTGMGVDAEIKVVRTAHADVKPYIDHSWLMTHGAGTTLGVLARFNAGEEQVSAFRLRGELRTYDANYLPGYFDTLYEFQRYQFVTEASPAHGFVPTKLAWLNLQEGEPRRYGYYLEASYALVSWFALTAALEDSTAAHEKGLMLHAEIPANRFLTFFLTYHRRCTDGFSIPFEFEEDTELFFWAVRLKLLPILAINYRSQRAFEENREARTTSDRLFANVFHFALDIEVGYEF